jgi:integrase
VRCWFCTASDAIGWPFGSLAKLLLLTAQRRDEVAGMEWSELDLDKRSWTIPRRKAKNDRVHEVTYRKLQSRCFAPCRVWARTDLAR